MKSIEEQVSHGFFARDVEQGGFAPKRLNLNIDEGVRNQVVAGIVQPIRLATGVDGIRQRIRELVKRSWDTIEIDSEGERTNEPSGSLSPDLLDSILQGDALKLYARVPSNSIKLIFTSPPYWQCRQYGGGRSELGREWHPTAYVENLLMHTIEWKRILSTATRFAL
jgi:hypothetical protein